MKDRIRLDKKLIMEVFCYSCQAFRSVHRAMQPGFWAAFQAYYTPAKREVIGGLIEQLIARASPRSLAMPTPRGKDLAKITPSPGLFRYLFGRWISQRKQTWYFAPEEIVFLISTLGRVLSILNRQEQPSIDELFDLQVDLCDCTSIFEMNCYGLPELARGRKVEHFDYTEWAPHFQLWEILGEPAPTSATSAPAKAAG